ncbi:MAG: T9SS type A sorting domain-containing protein, partial [Chitinophagales bacterium]|nr:T9SS type A sorting domain-containing protein [Chitinophagales bacterium]
QIDISEKNTSGYTAEIIDSMGKVVWLGKITQPQTAVDIKEINLAKGIYILKLSDNERSSAQNFTVN